MRCPGASVLCLSPPLVALSLARLAIRSGQSHPGLYTQPHQPGGGSRATAFARSGHSAATEEPAPSLTLPPTSVHVIVWCGDTPVFLPVTRRSIRATQACVAPGVHVAQPAPKAKSLIETEPRGPSQLRGVRGVSTNRTVPFANRQCPPWSEFVFVLVFPPCFGHFG